MLRELGCCCCCSAKALRYWPPRGEEGIDGGRGLFVIEVVTAAVPLLGPAAGALPAGDFCRKLSSSFSMIKYSFSNSLLDIMLSLSACMVL